MSVEMSKDIMPEDVVNQASYSGHTNQKIHEFDAEVFFLIKQYFERKLLTTSDVLTTISLVDLE